MENSYQVFRSHFPFLSNQDLEKIKVHSSIRTLQKKEFWQDGQNHYKVAFLVKGAIRAFYIDKNGKEITTILKMAGTTIVTPGAAHKQHKKVYFSQAIIATEIIEIPLSALLMLCPQNERIFQFYFLNTVNHLDALMERVENLISLKPEERMQFLLQHKKELVETIPHKYEADFIGITPVSFSRLLKKLTAN